MSLYCQGIDHLAPKAKAFQSIAIEQKLSTIHIPIAIAISELQSKANNATNGFKKSGSEDQGDFTLEYNIEKAGSLTVVEHEQELRFSVPIKVDLKVLWEKEIRTTNRKGPIRWSVSGKVKKTEDTSFTTTLFFKSKLGWQGKKLSLKTEADGFTWQKRPEIKLGPFTIRLSGLMGNAIKAIQTILATKIDSYAKEIDLDKLFTQLWPKIAEKTVIAISKEQDLWLKMDPESLSLGPIEIKDNNIVVYFVLKTYLNLLLDSTKPSFASKPTLENSAEMLNKFYLSAKVKLDYEEINPLLQKELRDKSYWIAGREIMIDDVQLYGNGEKIVLRMVVSKGLVGTLFFSGIPLFDQERQVIKIIDFDYHIETKKFLQIAARWFINQSFLDLLKNGLSWDMSLKIKNLKETLNEAINQQNNSLTLSGTVDQLEMENLVVTKDGLELQMSTTGKIKLHIGKIK